MSIKVAIIGSGISGLAAAHALRGKVDLSLYEAGAYFGGHTHTVEVTLPHRGRLVSHGVDTGFLVLNERTYPRLQALLSELRVPITRSDMSFSVQTMDEAGKDLEWSGSNLNTVFAQRSNLVKPRFWGMLTDLLRFNALTTQIAKAGTERQLQQPLGEFLRANGFGAAFCDWYFLPMMACIWSCPTAQMLQFPVSTMVRFCHNHGLLQITDRPQWWTVQGGAKHYVDKIVAGIDHKSLNTPVRRIEHHESSGAHRPVAVTTDFGTEWFDKVIIATHSDQALQMLASPSAQERQVLQAVPYQTNKAVLHTDASVLPKRRQVWAAWNYEHAAQAAQKGGHVCLHYLLNRLQPVPWDQPVIVSLNPVRPIAKAQIIGEYDYAHPVFDLGALAAQARMPALQGRHNRYFAGAWMGYGFHEDGLKAGLSAAHKLLVDTGLAAPGQPEHAA